MFILILILLTFTQQSFGQDAEHLTLDKAIYTALKNNKTVLLSAKDSLLQSEVSYISSKAQYKPQVSLTGSYLKNYNGAEQILNAESEISPGETLLSGDNSNLGLNLTQQFPIFSTGGNISLNCLLSYENYSESAQSSRLGLEFTQPLSPGQILSERDTLKDIETNYTLSQLSYKSSQEQLIYDIMNQYISLLKTEKAIERTRKMAEMNKDLLEVSRLRFNAGELAEIDMLNLDIQNKLDEDNIIMQERTLATTREDFLKLIGLPKGTTTALDPEINIKFQDYTYDECLKLAFQNRMDVKQQILSLDNALTSLQQTKYSNWPDISLQTNYYFEQVTGLGWVPQWEVNTQMTMPLYAGGVYKQNVRKAESSYSSTRYSYDELKESIERELEETITQIQMNTRRLEVLKSAKKMAEETLKVAELRFKMGITSYNDLTQDMDRYNQTEQTVSDTEFELVLLKARLLKAIGKLGEIYIK